MQDFYVGALRCPHGGVGGAEEECAFCAHGGGEMGDAGVVAEIACAAREQRGERGQWQVAGDESGVRGE